MNNAVPSIFQFLTLALLPVTISHPQAGEDLSNSCGEKLTQLEDEVEVALGSLKVIHLIENDTAFKSLEQKYDLYWIYTHYEWETNTSTCSARLVGIEATFQISNSTLPFVGMVHFTVDPSLNKVTGVSLHLPNT